MMTMPSVTRLLSLVLAAGLSTSALAVEGDWSQVAQALGKSGSEMPGGVYRVGLPRSDLKVTLDGVEVKPALALGSWLAFQKIGNDAMVMGDLVLTAEEVSPVMNKLAGLTGRKRKAMWNGHSVTFARTSSSATPSGISMISTPN